MQEMRSGKGRLLKIAMVVGAILVVALVYMRLQAGNVQQRLPSPDGRVIAECRILDFAAATDSAATTVQLRTRFNPLRHTVFLGLLDGGNVTISWPDSNTLVVKCARCDKAYIQGTERQWNSVSIRYVTSDSNQ